MKVTVRGYLTFYIELYTVGYPYVRGQRNEKLTVEQLKSESEYGYYVAAR